MNKITKEQATKMAKREMYEVMFFAVEELKEREEMSIYEFSRIFYDQTYSRETDALGYLRGKYIKYLEDGIISAYGRLDMSNRHKFMDWLTDLVFNYKQIPKHLEERIESEGIPSYD